MWVWLLLWLILGAIGTFLLWRFDKNPKTKTNLGTEITFVLLGPMSFVLGTCRFLTSIRVPNYYEYSMKKRITQRDQETNKESQWVKTARQEVEEYLAPNCRTE